MERGSPRWIIEFFVIVVILIVVVPVWWILAQLNDLWMWTQGYYWNSGWGFYEKREKVQYSRSEL